MLLGGKADRNCCLPVRKDRMKLAKGTLQKHAGTSTSVKWNGVRQMEDTRIRKIDQLKFSWTQLSASDWTEMTEPDQKTPQYHRCGKLRSQKIVKRKLRNGSDAAPDSRLSH